MALLKYISPFKYILVFTGVLLSQVGGVAAQPSQKPLLSRDGGGVPPNIVLTMDDSGSMMFQHMPEDTLYIGSYTVAMPPGGSSVRMDPSDDATLGGPGAAQGSASQFIGTIAARPGSTNYRQKLMRSPDTNTIYYNPEVRYLPWALDTYPAPAATGTNPAGRMANSPAAGAFRDPMRPTSGTGGVVDLTNIRSVSTRWCYQANTTTGCQNGSSSSSVNYDPGLYYRLNKNGSGAYLDPTNASNYTEYSINVGTSFPKVVARTDCSGSIGSSGCSQAQERQNFANWFTYYRTRNLLARGSLVEAFADADNTFRLGWGRINKSSNTSIDGVNTTVIQAGVREFNATTKTALFNWLYALPADGGTPLTGAMRAVGQYYKRADTKGPWSDDPGFVNSAGSDKTCRRSYHIMVTDGYWNASTTAVGNSDNTNGNTITGPGRSYQYLATRPYKDGNSDTLADYAMEYWKTDLRPDIDNNVVPSADNPAFWQHMVNFTVGLGVRGTLIPNKLPGGLLNPATDLPALTSGSKAWGSDKIDDLWHSALNSRGDFISAKDPSELAVAIRDSVGQALKRELREAGVATASKVLQNGNRKYVPLYRTGEWKGDVQAYVLDANGQAGAQLWSAETKVPAPVDRNIYTWSTNAVPASSVLFTNAAMGASNQTALGSLVTVPSSTRTDLINFLRGDRSLEGDGKPFRERTGVLGDFINSNPLLVKDSVNLGYASLPTGGTAYGTFLTTKASRTPVLFIGGNDGMLHAFKDTLGVVPADDGKEIFAYVPKTVIPNLSQLSDKTYGTTSLYHQYFVDGSLSETDAYINAPGASTPSWRNYLLGSLGSGGKAVFALDVTNTAALGATTVRWELDSTANVDLGYVSAPIEAGVLPNGEWVAIFGNGNGSTTGKAALFVVNLQTGVAQTLPVGAVGSNGLGGVGVLRDASGQITAVYAGDLQGQLWKFDYDATTPSRFAVSGGVPLFTAESTIGAVQPITQAPALFNHSRGGTLVVFGTGVLFTENDANSVDDQAVYGVWDKAGDSVPRPMRRTDVVVRHLSQITGAGSASFYSISGAAVNWIGSDRGWVIDLPAASGMRVVYPPQPVGGRLVLVSAVSPARNVVVCDAATGSGANLLIPVEDGLNPTYPYFDTNGDGSINSSDAIVVGYGTNADGIDAVLTGTRVCAGAICKTKISIQNTTGQQSGTIEDPNETTGVRSIKDRVWRRIVNPPIR